jgi:hypothetical protein
MEKKITDKEMVFMKIAQVERNYPTIRDRIRKWVGDKFKMIYNIYNIYNYTKMYIYKNTEIKQTEQNRNI